MTTQAAIERALGQLMFQILGLKGDLEQMRADHAASVKELTDLRGDMAVLKANVEREIAEAEARAHA